jgi:hypothetical protein|tara:strand:- start:598 stop:1656 length:1059 start_codon:yes stop_codon:yes gene_type:complete
MAPVSRTTFNSNTNTLYPDNVTAQITPGDLRSQMLDIADSVPFLTSVTTGAPDANDDSANSGSNGTFRVGDQWVDETAASWYVCLDATVGAAVWLLTIDANNNVLVDLYAAQTISNKTLFSPNMDGFATWRDNDKAIFGDDSDLQIYHDGNNSRIRDVGPGDLRIEGSNIRIEDFTTDDNFIRCFSGAGVELSYADSAKLTTTATGIDITGNIDVTGLVDGRDIAVDGTKLDGIEVGADVTDTTNVVAALTAGTNITISAGGVVDATDTNTTYSVGDGGLSEINFTTADNIKLDGIETGTTSVVSLPVAGTAGAGARHFVTDANATTFASVVVGGGANGVPVYSDGTNWRIG